MDKKLAIVVFTIFIDALGLGILIPVIPLLLADPTSAYNLLPAGADISQGYIMLGILTAIFPLMQFFAAPILGELSDKYGRKKILAISLAGTAASYVLFAIAIIGKNLPLLFFSRAFDGITGGNVAVAQAAIADLTEPKDRAKNFGLIGAAFGTGFIVGPFLGGKLSDPSVISWFNPATPFFFAAILSFLNTLSVIFIFKETNKFINKHVKIHWERSLHHIIKAFSNKNLSPLFLTTFIFFSGFTFFITFFSVFLIERFGFSQGRIGDTYSFIGIFIVLTQAILTRKVAKYFTEIQVVRFTILADGIFIGSLLLTNSPWQLYLILPFIAMNNGLTFANLGGLISRSAGPEIQGEILGINASVQAIAQTIPPLLSGFIAASFTPHTPILVASAVIICAGLFFTTFASRRIHVFH